MKRSLFAIAPLVLTCALGACAGVDVSSVGTIDSVAAAPTVAPPTEAGPTTVAATAAPTQPPSPTDAPVATQPPVSTAAPATTGAPTSSSVTNGGAELPTANCLALMQAGVDQYVDETIEVMYPALAECTGLQDWLAAAQQTNFDPGQDLTEWAAQVCGLDGPMLSVTCQEAFAAAQNQ